MKEQRLLVIGKLVQVNPRCSMNYFLIKHSQFLFLSFVNRLYIC